MNVETEQQTKTVRMVRPRLFTFELEFLIELLKEKGLALQSRNKELKEKIRELERKSDIEWVWRHEGYEAVIETDLKKLDQQLNELKLEQFRVLDQLAACRGLALRFKRIIEGKPGRHSWETEMARLHMKPLITVKKREDAHQEMEP